jgi:hypothetical protein
MEHYERIRIIQQKSMNELYTKKTAKVNAGLHWLMWDLSHKTVSNEKLNAKLQVIYNMLDSESPVAKAIMEVCKDL